MSEDIKPVHQKKPPRPASAYRGVRRNALKRGDKLTPHQWQTRLAYYGRKRSAFGTPVLPDNTLDYTFKGPMRANERER